MWRALKAVYLKEVREVLRDRRTVFLAFVIPLLFYPMILLLSSLLERYDGDLEGNGAPRIGIVGELPDEVMSAIGGRYFRVESVKDPSAALVIENRNKELVVYYRPSLTGELAMQGLVKRLLEVKDQKWIQNLEEEGVAARDHRPFEVKVQKLLGARDELALKYGMAIAYFLVFLAFTGCMSVSVDAGAGERERGTLEAMMCTSASLLSVGIGKLLFIISMGGLSVLSTLIGLGLVVFLRDEFKDFFIQALGFGFVIQVLCLTASVVVFFASVLYSISLLAKSAREAHLRASFVMMLTAALLIAAGAQAYTQSEWALHVPLMNVSFAITKALAGTLSFYECFIVCSYLIALALGLILMICRFFRGSPERMYLAD